MFRFTIRELVLLTLVVALGVGWWLEHREFLKRDAYWRSLTMELGREMAEMSMDLGKLGVVKPLADDNTAPETPLHLP